MIVIQWRRTCAGQLWFLLANLHTEILVLVRRRSSLETFARLALRRQFAPFINIEQVLPGRMVMGRAQRNHPAGA